MQGGCCGPVGYGSLAEIRLVHRLRNRDQPPPNRPLLAQGVPDRADRRFVQAERWLLVGREEVCAGRKMVTGGPRGGGIRIGTA